jgi:NADH-quinone oxidoreductase subunit K
MTDLAPMLLLAAGLFIAGVVCMILKRSALGILIGVELILAAAAVNFVAFAMFNPTFEVEGQAFALFVIVLGGAGAAMALAIISNFAAQHGTVDVDAGQELKG